MLLFAFVAQELMLRISHTGVPQTVAVAIGVPLQNIRSSLLVVVQHG